uniref:Ycf54 n=1 Tax=Pterocladia lucida TaxID=31408 RepID=A0A6M3WVL9_PTELU|nr:Ycf54 [Pterocladia lucida]
MNNYYFALASQNFLMNEEPVEEILRERTNYYKSINKNIDFWFVNNSNFIQNNITLRKTPNISYAAIISLDKDFILWLKLRMTFVIIGEFKSQLNEQNIETCIA